MAGPRLLKRKRIILKGASSSGNAYVDIPVLAGMQFIGTNGYLHKYRIVNDSTTTARRVRTQTVRAAYLKDGQLKYDSEHTVDVERIKSMPFLGTNGQIFRFKLVNDDPAPMTPEGEDDPHHFKKRYVRYYGNNNSTGSNSNWVDVEIIDRLKILGTNAQIFNFNLANPPAGSVISDSKDPYAVNGELTLGYCDPELELMPAEEGAGIDPPWRMDPFQNIVNISRQEKEEIPPFCPHLVFAQFGIAWNRIFQIEITASWPLPDNFKNAPEETRRSFAFSIPQGEPGAGNLFFGLFDGAFSPPPWGEAPIIAQFHCLYPDPIVTASGAALTLTHGGCAADIPTTPPGPFIFDYSAIPGFKNDHCPHYSAVGYELLPRVSGGFGIGDSISYPFRIFFSPSGA